jgi:hypothetical protein
VPHPVTREVPSYQVEHWMENPRSLLPQSPRWRVNPLLSMLLAGVAIGMGLVVVWRML